jgi:predicted nucleic acid-binding Zn finger protein
MNETESPEEKELWEKLRKERALSIEIHEEIRNIFGERGRKALIAVDEGRVKKYLDFFVVVGTSDEYVVDDEFCTCRAQIFRGGRCFHVLAARIAEMTGLFEEVDEWYTDTWKE